MSIADFIKGLPCHNEQNFSQLNVEQGMRSAQRRPPVHLPTEEKSSEQHTVLANGGVRSLRSDVHLLKPLSTLGLKDAESPSLPVCNGKRSVIHSHVV